LFERGLSSVLFFNEMDKEFMKRIPPGVKSTVRFHRGFDTGIIIATLMIQLAQKKMGFKKGDKNIYICSEIFGCPVDAIQIQTGSSFGSGRLSIFDEGKMALIFHDAKRDKSWRFRAGSFKSSIFSKTKRVISKVSIKKAIRCSEIKIAPILKDKILSGFIPKTIKDYFVSSGMRVLSHKNHCIQEGKIREVGRFSNAKTAFFAKRYGPFIRRVFNDVKRASGKYNLFAICGSSSEVIDAVQMITGLTLGNRHLIVSKKKEKAVSFINQVKGEGIRFSLEGRPIEENIKLKDIIERATSVTKINSCRLCKEMIFDKQSISWPNNEKHSDYPRNQ
jgi:formylmethanofuran dehydrogenase subunit E